MKLWSTKINLGFLALRGNIKHLVKTKCTNDDKIKLWSHVNNGNFISIQNELWLCAKMSMNTPDKDAFLHSKAGFISLRVRPQSYANSNSHTVQIYKETNAFLVQSNWKVFSQVYWTRPSPVIGQTNS